MSRTISRTVWLGTAGTAVLLALYFTVLTLISGWGFALDQFAAFWYYIVSLAVGFGVQVGLYVYLRLAIHLKQATGVVVASGTTSTIAMISCCAHYLVNILPVIGATGIIVFAAQYQVEFFWAGIIANLIGIAYISKRIYELRKV